MEKPPHQLEEARRLSAIYSQRKAEWAAAGRKLSQAVVAERCGWDTQSVVSQYMTGRIPLNVDALVRFGELLNFPPEDVSPRLAELMRRGKALAAETDGDTELLPGRALADAFRRTPIKGIAQLGPDGYWDALETSDGWIDIPTNDPDAYSLRVKGDSMAPAIRNGWAVWCEPNHALVPGEYVMVRRSNGQCMVKELLFENAEQVSLMSINPSYGRLTIPREEIEQIHYVGGIVPASKIRY